MKPDLADHHQDRAEKALREARCCVAARRR